MNKSGSVLILSLWVLILISLFALSVGFRMRLATKIERIQSDRFVQNYDYLSALNWARFLIESDDEPRVDHRADEWYGHPKQFEDMDFSRRFDLEIEDEESKVNLNRADQRLLLGLFEVLKRHEIHLETDPEDLSGSIVVWRGQTAALGKPTLGFKHKGAPFESVEELRLIQYISPNDVQRLRPFVTVYGSPQDRTMKVNLNTVHPYVLEALISGLSGGPVPKQVLLESLEKFRMVDRQQSTTPSLRGHEVPEAISEPEIAEPVPSPEIASATPGTLPRNDRRGILPGSHPRNDGAEGAEGDGRRNRQIFQQNDLQAQRFIQKLGLPNSLDMQQLVSQLMKHVTVDSQFFLVRVKLRSAETNPNGYPRPRALEAVLGPRNFHFPPNWRDPASLKLMKPVGRPITVPLEILSWGERVA